MVQNTSVKGLFHLGDLVQRLRSKTIYTVVKIESVKSKLVYTVKNDENLKRFYLEDLEEARILPESVTFKVYWFVLVDKRGNIWKTTTNSLDEKVEVLGLTSHFKGKASNLKTFADLESLIFLNGVENLVFHV